MAPKRGTSEHTLWRKRLSVAHKGKSLSEEHKQKMRVAHLGKHPSAETLAKMRVAHLGKHHSVEARAKMRAAKLGKQNPMSGKRHSIVAKQKMSAAKTGQPRPDLIGSTNPNWHGGVSSYPVDWTAHFRKAIRKRDNYTCALCGKVQNGQRHSVHHIDYDKKNSHSENLVTLCKPCHSKTGSDRKYWKNLFQMVYVPDFPKIRRKDESSS